MEIKRLRIFLVVLIILVVFCVCPVSLYSEDALDTPSSEKGIRIYDIDAGLHFMFYAPSFKGVNQLLDDFVLDEINFSSSFALEVRMGFKHNLYLGLMATIPVPVRRSSEDTLVKPAQVRRNSEITLSDVTKISNFMEYKVNHYGLIFEKGFLHSSRFRPFAGFVLGETKHEMTLSQTDGNNSWDLLKYQDLNNISQSYILRNYHIQPQIKTQYLLFDGVQLTAGLGYIIDFLDNSEWKAKYSNKEYKLPDAPDASLNGITFSIGFRGLF